MSDEAFVLWISIGSSSSSWRQTHSYYCDDPQTDCCGSASVHWTTAAHPGRPLQQSFDCDAFVFLSHFSRLPPPPHPPHSPSPKSLAAPSSFSFITSGWCRAVEQWSGKTTGEETWLVLKLRLITVEMWCLSPLTQKLFGYSRRRSLCSFSVSARQSVINSLSQSVNASRLPWDWLVITQH